MAPTGMIGDPNAMYQYALARTQMADLFLMQLGVASSSLAPPVISPVFPNPGNAPIPVTSPLPTMRDVTWSVPAMPAAFSGSLSIDRYLPAPFDEAPPVLSFPAAPTAFTDPIPPNPPIDLNFTYPTLSLTLPTPPALLSLRTYTFDGVNLPTLDSNVPELLIGAPSNVAYTPGPQYSSALLSQVQTTLLDRVANGGTGLPGSVETAIWDRAREREYRQMAAALAELEKMETLGYAFPPGVYIDARLKLQTEMQNTTAGLSREIMIKQAELEMNNILHSIDTAVTLESKLVDYINQIEQRNFESCRYATEAGISIYNARVQAYAHYLDAYKLKVAIYEAQIRGELAKVEAFKTEMESERIKAETNTAIVQSYRAQVDAALANVEVYKAQLAAIQTRAEVEKLKVQAFGEEVRAYVGKINAYTANVEAYKVGVAAETSKQEAFRSRVESYAARVASGVKEAEAKIEEYKGLIQAKIAELDGYKAAIAGASEQARATSLYNTSQSEVYRAQVAALSSYNDVLAKQWQVAVDQAQRVAEIGVSAAKANAELYMTTRSLALDASKVGAQVAAQLGSAALNAIHWSSSFGQSVSEAISTSTSYSDSTSHSESLSSSNSTNTNYNYSV